MVFPALPLQAVGYFFPVLHLPFPPVSHFLKTFGFGPMCLMWCALGEHHIFSARRAQCRDALTSDAAAASGPDWTGPDRGQTDRQPHELLTFRFPDIRLCV